MQKMITLDFLFNSRDLFTNILESGGLDGINLRLMISRDMKSPAIWSGIINLCARLCFETISFEAPLIVPKGRIPKKNACLQVNLLPVDLIDKSQTELINQGLITIKKIGKKQICIQSTSAQALGMVLNCLAANPINKSEVTSSMQNKEDISRLNTGDKFTAVFKPQGILNDCQLNGRKIGNICLKTMGNINKGKEEKVNSPIFSPLNFANLYKNNSANPFSQKLNAIWLIQSSGISFKTGLALFDMVTAMVMEATGICLPLVIDLQDSVFKAKNVNNKSDLLFILPVLLSFLPGSLPFLVNETEIDSAIDTKTLMVKFSDATGVVQISGNATGFAKHLYPWIKFALNHGGSGFSQVQAVRDQVIEYSQNANNKFKTIPDYKNEPPVAYEFTIGSETDDIFQAISRIETGQGDIFCEVWLSKPPELRSLIKNQIEKTLQSKGYNPKVLVLNAFKPGLCRILDIDLPDLIKIKPARVHISYNLFDTCNNELESKHRWLHELFPVAEILAEKLGLPQNTVTLSIDIEQNNIYSITAFDEQDGILFQDMFSPFFHTFDYMTTSPDIGTVAPCCSGITVSVPDRIILKQTVPTDRDRFWKQFQNTFIPDLIKSMEILTKSKSLENLQAFFESININVCIDESNYRIGFMDEQISPMETLHEDIYFFLLKTFEQFSLKHKLPEALRLGQILPRVYSNTQGIGAWAKITATPSSRNKTSLPKQFKIPAMTFDTLFLNEDGWTLSGNIQGSAKKKHSLALDISLEESDIFNAGEIHSPAIGKSIPLDRLLTSKEVCHQLAHLNKLPHIQTWEITKSLQGRPVYAVEAFLVQGTRVSVPRLRIERPTILFNARHHANEISSTTAVLKFIEFIGSTQGQSLLETANIVLIPIENVDDVATFEDLYVKDSCDILHAARYNSVGAEFYDQYFKYPPVFPEALAKQRLWHRWLPELMADLHGVPGHEWCQPYAGYLPLGFREFWIPRAFVYVHIPFIEDLDHPLYRQAMELTQIMRKAMAKDKKIVAANEKIMELYQKYARDPEPSIFPSTENKELTALPLLGRAAKFNFAMQYPDITRAEVIVEVPDEVVHGKNLELCIAAHFKIQKAMIEALNQRSVKVVTRQHAETGNCEFEFCLSKAKQE